MQQNSICPFFKGNDNPSGMFVLRKMVDSLFFLDVRLVEKEAGGKDAGVMSWRKHATCKVGSSAIAESWLVGGHWQMTKLGRKTKSKKKTEFWLRSAMCPVVVKMKGVFFFFFLTVSQNNPVMLRRMLIWQRKRDLNYRDCQQRWIELSAAMNITSSCYKHLSFPSVTRICL